MEDLAEERRARRRRSPVRPTEEMIRQRAVQLTRYYAAQDQQIDMLRRARELAESIELPAALQRVPGIEMHDPTALDEIDRIFAAVTVYPPRCVVTAADPASDEGQVSSDLRERFTEQLFREAGTRTPGMDAMEQIVDACFGDGGAWFKQVLDKDIWESVWAVEDEEEYWVDPDTGEEATELTRVDRRVRARRPKSDEQYLRDREAAKRAAGVPIVLIACDTRCVYPVWSGSRLVEMLEITERPTIEVLETYGRPRGRGRELLHAMPVSQAEASQYPQTVLHYEHWTPAYVTYCADFRNGVRSLLRQVRHNYGFVPYYFAPGRMANYWRGRKVGWGVAQNKLGLMRYRQFIWNLIVQIAAQTAGTPMQHTRPVGGESIEGENDAPRGEMELWQLNGIYEAQPGERFEPIALPGIPVALRELLEILNQMIANLDTPRVNAIGGGLEGAGFAIAQVLTEAKTRFDPYVRHIEQALTAATRDAWRLLREHIDEPVHIHYTPANPRADAPSGGWITVNPARDLTDAVGVRWEINAEPPTASIVKSRYALELVERGLMSMDQAIEFLGYNPAEVRRGIAMDRIRKEGFYIDAVNRQVMEGLRRGDLLAQAASRIAATGTVPGMPPELAALLAPGSPMAMPPGTPPGGPVIPDMGNLAVSPGGAGASPQAPPGGGGGFPGAAPGVGPGAVVPQQAAMAGMQRLGTGG